MNHVKDSRTYSELQICSRDEDMRAHLKTTQEARTRAQGRNVDRNYTLEGRKYVTPGEELGEGGRNPVPGTT